MGKIFTTAELDAMSNSAPAQGQKKVFSTAELDAMSGNAHAIVPPNDEIDPAANEQFSQFAQQMQAENEPPPEQLPPEAQTKLEEIGKAHPRTPEMYDPKAVELGQAPVEFVDRLLVDKARLKNMPKKFLMWLAEAGQSFSPEPSAVPRISDERKQMDPMAREIAQSQLVPEPRIIPYPEPTTTTGQVMKGLGGGAAMAAKVAPLMAVLPGSTPAIAKAMISFEALNAIEGGKAGKGIIDGLMFEAGGAAGGKIGQAVAGKTGKAIASLAGQSGAGIGSVKLDSEVSGHDASLSDYITMGAFPWVLGSAAFLKSKGVDVGPKLDAILEPGKDAKVDSAIAKESPSRADAEALGIEGKTTAEDRARLFQAIRDMRAKEAQQAQKPAEPVDVRAQARELGIKTAGLSDEAVAKRVQEKLTTREDSGPLQASEAEKGPDVPPEARTSATENLNRVKSDPVAETGEPVVQNPAGEPTNRPPGLTSPRRAWIDEDVAGRGIDVLPAPETVHWEQRKQEAISQKIPEQADSIAAEVNAKPRSLNEVETAGMTIRFEQLKQASDEAYQRVKDAPEGSAEEASAIAEANRYQQQLENVYTALRSSGTVKGRELAIQKFTIDKDYNLATVLAKAKVNKGKSLTPQEKAWYEKRIGELEEVNRKLQEATGEKASAVPEDPAWLAGLSKKASEARARLASKFSGSTLHAGLDPTILSDLAIIGAEKIARGAKTAVEFTKSMSEDLGENWKNLKQHVRDIYKAAKDYHAASMKATKPQVEELKQKRERVKADRQKYDAAKNERYLRETQKQIDTLTQHIEKGTLPEPKPKPQKKSTPELDAARARRDDLRKQLANSEPAQKARIQKQIGELNEKLSSGKIGLKPEAAQKKVSKEVERMMFERDRLRHEINKRIDAQKPKSIIDKAANPLNLSRAIMTTDLPPVFRQAAWFAFGRPVKTAKALVEGLRALKSEQAAYKAMKDLDARPNAPRYYRQKLFSAFDGPLSSHEEAFMSNWIGKLNKVPVLKLVPGAERAYTVFLNRLRADVFDGMMDNLSKGREATAAEEAAIGMFIREATGKGGLGKLEPAAVALNTAFFSPRYVASRFQLMALHSMWGGSMATRKLIAMEYGRMLAGVGLMYGLATLAGVSVGTDPRSSDFGKLRIGNTRIDPLGGISQATVLISRLATGETKNSRGEVVPLSGETKTFGGQTRLDVASRFMRTKLSPVFGAVANVLEGEDVVGQKTDIATEAGKMVVPLSFGDIYKAMKEHGVPAGTALGMVSLLGASVNTYSPRKKEERPKKGLKKKRSYAWR
jgi:hypothetical protein